MSLAVLVQLALYTYGCLSLGIQPFKADSSSQYIDSRYPLTFILNESLVLQNNPLNSFWANSFVSASDGHQYMVIGHTNTYLPGSKAPQRSSVYDITIGQHSAHVHYETSLNSTLGADGRLNINFGNNSFSAISDDNISQLRYAFEETDYSYDIRFDATTPALLNLGSGLFQFGKLVTYEWALPRARTHGKLTMNGTTVEIDPENSFTWFDRQYIGPLTMNATGKSTQSWTWLELHWPYSNIKASMWSFRSTNPDESFSFASVSTTGGMEVMLFNLTSIYADSWTSPRSNVTYPQNWLLDFDNGDSFMVSSVHDDQEISDPVGGPTYEGYVLVEGTFLGETFGIGNIEVVTTFTAG